MYEQWGKVTSTEVAEDVAKARSSNYYIHPSYLLIRFKVMLVLEPMPVANCVIHFLCCGFAIFQSSFLVWSHVFHDFVKL